MSYVKSHPLEIQPIISNSTTQSLENPNPKPLIKKRDVHSSPLSWTRLFLDSKITHDSIHPCASGNKTGKKETKKKKKKRKRRKQIKKTTLTKRRRNSGAAEKDDDDDESEQRDAERVRRESFSSVEGSKH